MHAVKGTDALACGAFTPVTSYKKIPFVQLVLPQVRE